MGRGRRGGPKRGNYKNHGSRGNKSTRGGGNFKNKRKFNKDGDGKKDVTSENKRQKLQLEKESVPFIEEESSSSESEEEVKPYTQLLSMFKSSSRAQQVLTSDEEQSDDGDETEDVNDQSPENDIDNEDKDSDLEDSDQEDEEVEEEEDGEEEEDDSSNGINGAEEIDEEDSTHEGLEVEDSEEEDSGDEEEETSTDPYHLHFEREMDENLLEILTLPKPYETKELKWKVLGRMVVHLPITADKKKDQPKPTLLGETIEKYVVPATLPMLKTGIPLREYGVKLQLCSNLDTRPLSDNNQTADELLSPLQHELFTLVNEYRDVYYPETNHLNNDDIRTVYCLHSLNHVMKSRDKVLLHNAKLKKAKENGVATDEIEYRDQGLVRPRVLIIAPLRNSAVK
jgi:U3 small nucleolar RNA-associated protein 25